jgi:hypothetical protein
MHLMEPRRRGALLVVARIALALAAIAALAFVPDARAHRVPHTPHAHHDRHHGRSVVSLRAPRLYFPG